MQIESTEKTGKSPTTNPINSGRRYDIDYVRILVLGLLIIYHNVISFQPFAAWIAFPQNEQSLEGLWTIMSMFNVWRIPILFLISGMAVFFAMEHRNWQQLLKDRIIRILIPFIFGFLCIGPINIYVVLLFYGEEARYIPNSGHLWFLANIFLYVVFLLPLLIYLRKRPGNFLSRVLSRVFRRPLAFFLLALPLMLETWLVNPDTYTFYANTAHGFWLGLMCFFMGFVLTSIKDVFWPAVERMRWITLAVAVSLYLLRVLIFETTEATLTWVTGGETMIWMLAILGFGSLHLHKPSRSLDYFSKAVYPVYIVHLPIQFILAYFILPLALPAFLKLSLLLIGTLGISLLSYEYVLRRIKWIRPLFGMKLSRRDSSAD